MTQMKIPNQILAHDYSGLELDWIGIDQVGNIGYFCTGGKGPVPKQALESAPNIDEAAKLILSLPQCSEIRIVEALKEWEDLGKRGIYVFDWSHQSNQYRAVIVPSHPTLEANAGISHVLKTIIPAKIEGRFQDGL